MELYAHILSPGRPIPIDVAHSPVDEYIPGEEDIAEAVLGMQLHCARGPSYMKDEHLRMWLCVVRRVEDPDLGNWEKVISII